MHGEAGVGKTRLVAELTELAGHTGGLTAIGTTPTIGCPPYWPWAELGSALLRSDLVFQWYLQPADGGGTNNLCSRRHSGGRSRAFGDAAERHRIVATQTWEAGGG